MASGFIQVAPDSTGKLLQTVHNTIGGNDVHAEAVLLVDQNGNVIATLPISIADGSDTTLGAKADAKSTATDATPISAMQVLKQISASVQAPPAITGTVTANAGTNLNTSALALDTSVNGILLAQGSTTSGQKGNLAQGAVTTAAPSYTTAQTSPLSLDTSGLLRLSLKDTPQNTNAFKVDGSAVVQPVSGTVTTTPPTNASTNVAQFGGTNVVTGTGAGGSGIPRVTVSNDSTITANAGTNLNTSALALESGGNLATLAGVVSSAKAAVKSADGDFVTVGAKTDARSTATDATSVSAMQVLKEISFMAQNPATVTVALAATTRVSSTGYENAHVLKNSAGKLVSLIGYNSKTTAQFIQLFDVASIPSDGNIPVLIFTVPAVSNFSLDVPLGALPFATGIVVCNSSTGATKTIGANDCFFTAVVI